jgi:hypothetical protein
MKHGYIHQISSVGAEDDAQGLLRRAKSTISDLPRHISSKDKDKEGALKGKNTIDLNDMRPASLVPSALLATAHYRPPMTDEWCVCVVCRMSCVVFVGFRAQEQRMSDYIDQICTRLIDMQKELANGRAGLDRKTHYSQIILKLSSVCPQLLLLIVRNDSSRSRLAFDLPGVCAAL